MQRNISLELIFEMYSVFDTNFFSIQRRGDSYLSGFYIDGELFLPVATFYQIRHVAVLPAVQIVCEHLKTLIK